MHGQPIPVTAQPGQVIQFPQPQFPQPQTVPGQQGGYGPAYAQDAYLPAFPMLAAQVDRHARRVPWYVWFGVGLFCMHRLLRRR